MNRTESKKRKSSPAGVIALVAFFAIINVISEAGGEGIRILAVLLVMVIPIVLFVWALTKAKKKAASSVHTHDRIDHRSDLKINPKTGKTEARKPITPHSPKEHWKQQLDGLLASGMIDMEEYRKLINRRF